MLDLLQVQEAECGATKINTLRRVPMAVSGGGSPTPKNGVQILDFTQDFADFS